jgi:tetratricopeptide (TPR) repeat protein
MAMLSSLETSEDIQERSQYKSGMARLHLARGRPTEALFAAEEAVSERDSIGISSEAIKEALVSAVEATLQLGDVGKAEELIAIVDALPPGRSPQFLQAHSSRFRALLAARRGDLDEAERLFKRSTGLFRELSVPFHLAVTLLEQAEWLAGQDRADEGEGALADARELFERLGAKPWLERVGALEEARA